MLGQQLFRNKDPNAHVRGHVAVYGIGTSSDELEVAAKSCADEYGAVLTKHQSFHADDVGVDDARFGRHPLVHYSDLGVLGSNCTFSHMNFIRDDEMAPIVESGLAIAWNPGNYLNYGIGSMVRHRMPELFRLGVPVAPGTDVAKVWGFGEQGFLSYLAAREKDDFLSAEDVLEMATVCGARAIGLGEWLGSIEPGKRADLVIRSDAVPEGRPILDRIRNLVLISRSKSVDTVIVDGRVVLEHGRPTLVDDPEVYEVAERSARAVVARVGMQPGTTWPFEP
jgi:5-methylthioadenosine/S-adenosylhomocysteine deaminase